MGEKIRGIVLNVRKYNDRNSIVTLYTRERGRVSFISAMGSGKASNSRRARLQPLSLIETEVNFKASTELQRLGAINTPEVWNDLYFHPVKIAVALFISEFLYKLLNDTTPDGRLFDFLEKSIRFLDRMEAGVSNFYIPFLVSMLTFSGIQPDTSQLSRGNVFEFASGAFVPEKEAKGIFMKGEEGEAVKFVCRINFNNMKCLRLNGTNRRQILYGLLNYYSYHFPGLGNMKSPDVLRETFDQ